MTYLKQNNYLNLGWQVQEAALKGSKDFDLRINDVYIWVNEAITEAKKTLAVEEIKLLPKTPSARLRSRRSQRTQALRACVNAEAEDANSALPRRTRRNAGKQAKIAEVLSTTETSQLEDLEENDKENVGESEIVKLAKKKNKESVSKVETTAEHRIGIANKVLAPTVPEVALAIPDVSSAKKGRVSRESDCEYVEMKDMELQVDLSYEEVSPLKDTQAKESKALTNLVVADAMSTPASTRSKSKRIQQLQEMLFNDPSFGLKPALTSSVEKPKTTQRRSLKRQPESGIDGSTARNKRHRIDILSPVDKQIANSRSVQSLKSSSKDGIHVSSCYPVLKKLPTPSRHNSSSLLQCSAVKVLKNQEIDEIGSRSVMIKVKKMEENSQRKKEELLNKQVERKRLREEHHISVMKRRQELEESAAKKVTTPRSQERASVLAISCQEKSKLRVLREQKLEAEQKRQAEETKRLEKERLILEEKKRRLEEQESRLRLQRIAEQKKLEEERRVREEEERLKILELQKLREKEIEKRKAQEPKLREAQKLKEERERKKQEQIDLENKRMEEKKRQDLELQKQAAMDEQNMQLQLKSNSMVVLKMQNYSSSQNVTSSAPSSTAASTKCTAPIHPPAGPEKNSNLNKTFEIDANSKSAENKDCQSYEMTPCAKKPKAASTLTNYNIDDINSDDSTDDETQPRKKIPNWAQGNDLKLHLIKQFTNLLDVDALFGEIFNPDLNLIFANKIRSRFNKRTSSANWDEPMLPRSKPK